MLPSSSKPDTNDLLINVPPYRSESGLNQASGQVVHKPVAMVKRAPSTRCVRQASMKQTPAPKDDFKEKKRKAIVAGLRKLRAPAATCLVFRNHTAIGC